MIDSILNLLFRCSHRRLTRPVTPVGKSGIPMGGAYVVCLDCGKQFAYDTKEMRMGRALARSVDSGVLHPEIKPAPSKMKYALWLTVPLALIAGLAINKTEKTPSNRPVKKEPQKPSGNPV